MGSGICLPVLGNGSRRHAFGRDSVLTAGGLATSMLDDGDPRGSSFLTDLGHSIGLDYRYAVETRREKKTRKCQIVRPFSIVRFDVARDEM